MIPTFSCRRAGAPLFGQIAREFRKHTSPLPRQKKMVSDFQVMIMLTIILMVMLMIMKI